MMVRLMITSSQFEWGMILCIDALDKGFFDFIDIKELMKLDYIERLSMMYYFVKL